MSLFLVILGGLALIAILNVFNGWILSMVWNWFIPLLGGPIISIPIAVGLACIVSMVTPSPTPESGKEGERIFISIVKTLVLFFIAWFFHLFADPVVVGSVER